MSLAEIKQNIFDISIEYQKLFSPGGKPLFDDDNFLYDDLIEKALLLIFSFCAANKIKIEGYDFQKLSINDPDNEDYFWWDVVNEMLLNISEGKIQTPQVLKELILYFEECFYDFNALP